MSDLGIEWAVGNGVEYGQLKGHVFFRLQDRIWFFVDSYKIWVNDLTQLELLSLKKKCPEVYPDIIQYLAEKFL
jgi:hypothetical protein